jgi:D-alanyl-D-alanine carboxypeptidase
MIYHIRKHPRVPVDFSQDPGFQDAVFENPTQAPPPEKLLAYFYEDDPENDPPLLFDPGSEYRYSNSDNIAVALMVEAVTGKTYEDQLQKRVYGPLGLKKTSLPAGTKLKKP